MEKTYKIEFTVRNILLIAGIPLLLFVAWQLKFVIFIFFIAFILSSAIRPPADALKRKGIPKVLSILIIYTIVFGLIGFIIYISGVSIVDQFSNVSQNAQEIVQNTVNGAVDTFPALEGLVDVEEGNTVDETINNEIDSFFDDLPGFLAQGASGSGGTIVSYITNVGAAFFAVFTVIMLSVYMSISDTKVYDGILDLINLDSRKVVRNTLEKVESKLGHWVVGQFLLMLIVGFATFLGLWIPTLVFDVEFGAFAISLALIAGMLEVIPNIGPTLTLMIGMVLTIGSGGSILETLYIGIMFLTIQQLEAVFIVPNLMRKVIGIDPIVTIIGIVAGATLFGLPGAILSLPVIATVQLVFDETVHPKKDFS